MSLPRLTNRLARLEQACPPDSVPWATVEAERAEARAILERLLAEYEQPLTEAEYEVPFAAPLAERCLMDRVSRVLGWSREEMKAWVSS